MRIQNARPLLSPSLRARCRQQHINHSESIEKTEKKLLRKHKNTVDTYQVYTTARKVVTHPQLLWRVGLMSTFGGLMSTFGARYLYIRPAGAGMIDGTLARYEGYLFVFLRAVEGDTTNARFKVSPLLKKYRRLFLSINRRCHDSFARSYITR